MIHDLDPFIWQISGNFGIRWYGMAYLAGFMLSFWIIYRMATSYRAQIPVRLISDFITYCALGTMIGGRLGYVLFYSPDLLTRFKPELPFWGVFAVNEGGMASHGGMIGLVIACILFAKKHKVPVLHLLDLVAFCAPVGVFLGRIANFINGELVGRECDPSFALGVKFPTDILGWPKHSPEKLKLITPVIEKMGLSVDQWLQAVSSMREQAASRDFIYDTLEKIIQSIQNGGMLVRDALGPFLVARHPSQLYAAFGEGIFLFLCLLIIWHRPRKPGVITSSCVVIYAIVRIVDEHFRMPDEHIGYQLFDLTRGQWLSIAMFVTGLFLMLFWGRRHATPVGGWGRKYN
jgi:phosphatidylglycerol:prolipoprotein diacylglycerol transferase